jgi:N6-L-threonylcarbamoyladenine synthase
MIVLGIETSCDETACGIVRDGTQVLASTISSQIASHQRFGGVVPEVAAREHLAQLDRMVGLALSDAGLEIDEIDAIAVTRGPGLIGALLVGVSYAKGLALSLEKPLIPVDHVFAHLHGALLGSVEREAGSFPAFGLVVSGGHTNLYLMRSITSFELIGQSSDDACGECFDKVAKLLGLSYPGGPAIEALAKGGDAKKIQMPRMVEERAKLMFSYSGLKTHIANLLIAQSEAWITECRADLCAAFQDEAFGQLVRKLSVAMERYPEAKQVIVAGGVAANQRFRELMATLPGLSAIFPDLVYCSDNGAMIAASGYYGYRDGIRQPSLNWDAYARHQA